MSKSLVINPGSTSTKVAVYEDLSPIFQKTIRHTQDELEHFESIVDQEGFRTNLILNLLGENNINAENIDIYIAIGGLIKPGKSGAYIVNDSMIQDLKVAKYNEHAANLGALIANELANKYGKHAYIADAITADEMADVARLSGIPEITRSGRCHTLNQKYTARKASKELGISYEKAHLVVVHLGGGISITAHRDGQMVDTNAARGEGPFCIDRSGGVNSFELANLCLSGKYTKKEMLGKINGNGGVVAYLNTRDFMEVERRVNNSDKDAVKVFEAMSYQIAKEIAAMTVPLNGKIDAIVLTGGMANSQLFCRRITEYVEYLSKVLVYPGEGEMETLAEYAFEILNRKLKPMEYIGD